MKPYAETNVVWPQEKNGLSASECERSFLLPQLMGSLAGETCALTGALSQHEPLPSSPNGWFSRGLKALFA
ncbi:hypothetical protein NX10_20765 [Pseudomonas fluorescens]|uniref:hypothetical protein n=1 Tax=Pseudomonas fluorescens group TaxID=136843 RepID=UPI000585295F|nr:MULTISPECIES: hypothetical protein [Pseudomonas fluorescens group]KIF57213.1 hypothetical protein NX10_20765 [Pseudomonas fluorescens]MDR7053904.1 hypothetical protein [Pseudomonas koreensis]